MTRKTDNLKSLRRYNRNSSAIVLIFTEMHSISAIKDSLSGKWFLTNCDKKFLKKHLQKLYGNLGMKKDAGPPTKECRIVFMLSPAKPVSYLFFMRFIAIWFVC